MPLKEFSLISIPSAFAFFEKLFTMPETWFTLVNSSNLHLLPGKGQFKKQSC